MRLLERYREMQEIIGYAGAEGSAWVQESPQVETPGSVARGDSMLDAGDGQLKSVLPGVSDPAWSQFVRGMASADLAAVSDSNALGMFEMMPRRLCDLGIVTFPRRQRASSAPNARMVWVAVFVPPLTPAAFLRSPQMQYAVFCRSMADYSSRVKTGEIAKPKDTSLSGALAVLHRSGPQGLEGWEKRGRFPATERAYERVAGIF